jgi:hypothetical protein
MPIPSAPLSSKEAMTVLSTLLLSPDARDPNSSMTTTLRNLSQEEFSTLVALAHSNHVIVRGLTIYREIMLAVYDQVRAEWAATAIASERARIVTGIAFLRRICDAFDEEGLDVTVMKSLDHWPDLGSDLDLYTNAPAQAVRALLQKRFGAQIAHRSWGDRLACKWNFNIPGLPDPVEVHAGRLGQTGEQLVLASRLPERSRMVEIEGQIFQVPSASDRIMISTLQRMYRHFYFRLCDIVDSAKLISSGDLNHEELRSSAQDAGIWEGVATYLVIVSDYVRSYGAADLGLPSFVKNSAHFEGNIVHFRGSFLRVPILPQSAGLYRSQFAGLLRRRELQSSARLGLLPWLATAAAISHKITGSDKGIW